MWALAVPLIIGNFAQSAIGITDVLVLGRYNVEALAASALAVNFLFMFSIFAMGVLTAASPMIAEARGRRSYDVREIRRTVRQAFWAAAMLSIPIWFIMWHSEYFMLLLGQAPDLSQMAGEYLRVAMWGIFPFLGYIILRYYVSALEKPIWGMVITLLGVLVNLVVDVLLVFGLFGLPEMGLIGAAFASFLANLSMLIGMILVVTLRKPFRRYQLFGRFWVSDWARFADIFRVGVPIGVIFAFEVAIFSAAAFLMGLIDEYSLAAHAISLQITAFAFMIPLGLSQAATVRLGVHHGRRDSIGVTQAGWSAFLLGIISASCTSLIMLIFPKALIGLFINPLADSESAHVFALAVGFLFVAALFQFVDALQAIGAGVLRGLQDTKWPMVFASIGYWVVGIGTAWYLAFDRNWQGLGIWVGLASGLGTVSILMLIRWIWRARFGLGVYKA